MTPCQQLALDASELHPDARSSNPVPSESTPALVQPISAAQQIDITGGDMLLALAVALCLAGPFAWAFVRYWLFAL
jgi:hypothetical protein